MKSRNRTHTRAVLAIAVAVALVAAACGDDDTAVDAPPPDDDAVTDDRPDPAELTEITVAGIPPFSVTAWPYVIADNEGYFAEEGVSFDPVYTFEGPPLLAGGDVDLMSMGADDGLLAAERGLDAIVVAPLANRITNGLIVRDDITSLEDLVGTTMRTKGPADTGENLFKAYLEAEGIDPDSVDYAAILDDGAALTQLEAGQIAGGLYDQGVLLQAERGDIEGLAVLIEPADFGVYPWNVIMTTRSFAEANEDALIGFIRATQRAIEFIRDPANEEAVLDAVSAADPSLDRDRLASTYAAARAFGDFVLYSTEPLTSADIEPAVDYIDSIGEEISFELDEFIENRYVEAARAN